ncbi:MAG TPA: S9 family peptidase, partial [bacterium]|nr:S9 family peptidase [bacterium]
MSAQRRAPRPDDLANLVTVSDAQISPDGASVAFVRTEIDLGTDEYRSTIWLAGTGGGEAVQLTRGGRRDSAPRWSPDGRTFAFLSDREGTNQLYLLPLAGGEPRRVTSLPRGAGPAVWAP